MRWRAPRAVLVLLLAAGGAVAAEFADAVRRDCEWLAARPTRTVGSADHDAVLAELEREVRALAGVEVWTHRFPVVVPRVERAELTVAGGPAAGTHRVYPLWPANVRLHTTSPEGIEGDLVYVGRAAPQEVPARRLRDQIAVVELTAGGNWTAVVGAGARAVVLLGSDEETQLDTQAHFLAIPVYLPRYYVPPGPLASALRGAGGAAAGRGRLTCRAEWVTAEATNVYALVRPTTPSAAPQQALAVAVPLDATGLVPELSRGADAAVDAAFALNLLRRLAARPPPRPVLVTFADAQSLNLQGMRQMLAALAVPAEDRQAFTEADDETIAEYGRREELAAGLEREARPLEVLWTETYKPLHRFVKEEVAREVIAIETEMHPLRLKLHQTQGEEREALAGAVGVLAERRSRFFAVQLQLLNRAPGLDSTHALAAEIWARARRRIRQQLAEAEAVSATDAGRTAVRGQLLARLGLTGQTARPLAFVLGVDLSDAGTACGPLLSCRFLFTNESRNASNFLRWLSDTDKKEGGTVWPGDLHRVVELGGLGGLEAPESFSVGDLPTLTSTAESFGTAAVTWATLDGMRWRVDTNGDRPDRLDWARLTPQVEATLALVDRLTVRTDFQPATKVIPRWQRVPGTIVDLAPGEPVPRLPLPGYLVGLVSGSATTGRASVRYLPPAAGVRREEFRRTGADGRFLFDALPVHVGSTVRTWFVQAYQFDADGRITRAVDMRRVGKGVSLNVDLATTNPTPLRAVAFTCREMSGTGFLDPRFLQPLPAASLLDARRGGEPRRLNFSLWNGMLSCQLEEELRWQLILRAGVTRNRMALLNVADPAAEPDLGIREAMRGFRVGEALPVPPLYMAARDLYRLDQYRLDDYRQAGITSKSVEGLRERTRALLAEADAALARDDGGALHQAAMGALANEVRAYQAIRDTANDVVRGAIFLLLALAPFAYALERLLVATPYVYRQIAAMGGIFTVMAAVLWSFHPAFRMSSQPLMIVMAFGIILVSLLVISVVYSKFESGLEEMRSGRAETSGARTSRLGVLVTAVRLGIANMRKRKLRSTLTGVTIVLITFALLCFTSTSRYVGQREFTVAATAPYTGVLVRQASGRALPLGVWPYLEQVAGAERPVVPRVWWSNPWSPQWRLHVRNPQTGKQASLQAGLGLAPGEAALTGIGRFCPDWERFARTGGCYLARQTAADLGLAPGDRVQVAGLALELIGTYDPAALDQEWRDLDGESLLPADYSALGDEQRNLMARSDLELLSIEMESGAGLEARDDLRRVSGTAVAILPVQVLKGLRDCSLRSLAVATPTPAAAQALTAELLHRLAFPIYFGTQGQGTRVAATTPLLPKAPKSLLIPLLIAACIIFNTMLSSIAERRREIYIYTSLGLAPLHVGFLFLAEAVTYGLMGSVFGYIVGQAVATVFSRLGWMGGITLNYSGTQAIAVMLMVLAVVILSSLVPAFLAGRLAAPSNRMSWDVPAPVGDVIRDTLPFTATEVTANGLMAFLVDYLDAHREGSIGTFSTDRIRTFRASVAGTDLIGVEATVWLAPYDLGVRQTVEIRLTATGDADVLGIGIELRRGSGPLGNWRKLNRVFLGDLRRQMLGWRKLKTERVLQYIAAGREQWAAAGGAG